MSIKPLLLVTYQKSLPKKRKEGFSLLVILCATFFLSLLLLLLRGILYQQEEHFLQDYQQEEALFVTQAAQKTAERKIEAVFEENLAPPIGVKTIPLENSSQQIIIPVALLNLNTQQENDVSPALKVMPLLSGASSWEELLKKTPIASRAWCFFDPHHAAPWQEIRTPQGKLVARYAYLILDEQGKPNLSLHRGLPRNNPLDWDQGPATLPLCFPGKPALGLLTPEEAVTQKELIQEMTNLTSPLLASLLPHLLFKTPTTYQKKKEFFRSEEVPLPEIIPNHLPEAGHPKYNLNDLATNRIYGATAPERASYIANIIDHNLPHFKERDPSLRTLPPQEQKRYLNRIAASIVDYIDPDSAPTLFNQGEPAGRDLFPLPTQLAERTAINSISLHDLTLDSQYFLQVWNPYTQPISVGNSLKLVIHHRQRLHWGTEQEPINTPLNDYEASTTLSQPIRPNESIVVAFPTRSESWHCGEEVPSSHHPYWQQSPQGNGPEGEAPLSDSWFQLYWNDALIDQNARLTNASGKILGGLDHEAATLQPHQNCWECNFLPTEKDRQGHYRFVADPRDNYLTSYLWKCYSGTLSYLTKTRWQGVTQTSSPERSFDPARSWANRDFLPINPPTGNPPLSKEMLPSEVPSNYDPRRDAPMAPFFLRNGPMNSIIELGNIDDPAQADDLGNAPIVATYKGGSCAGSGGGRTLAIGKPEFPYWDHEGFRAIELLDLFTIPSHLHQPYTPHTLNDKNIPQNLDQKKETTLTQLPIMKEGLININTASYTVLTALFLGISPTSDVRFPNSTIDLPMAEKLAQLVEERRPFQKLSELEFLTPYLANATTYTPPLSNNQDRLGLPLAMTLDRTRQEGFAKFLSHCTTSSRLFKIIVITETLDPSGKPQKRRRRSIIFKKETDKAYDSH